MSLAWGTIAVLVLLLPGFLFFIGLYLGERISRETIQAGFLSELALIVFISFIIHSSLFIFNHYFCGYMGLVCINPDKVISSLETNLDSSAIVGSALRDYPKSVVGYFLLVDVLGFFFGRFIGKKFTHGGLV